MSWRCFSRSRALVLSCSRALVLSCSFALTYSQHSPSHTSHLRATCNMLSQRLRRVCAHTGGTPSGLGAFCPLPVLPPAWRLLRRSGRRTDLAAEQLLLCTCCVQVQRTPATSGPGDNSPALKGQGR